MELEQQTFPLFGQQLYVTCARRQAKSLIVRAQNDLFEQFFWVQKKCQKSFVSLCRRIGCNNLVGFWSTVLLLFFSLLILDSNVVRKPFLPLVGSWHDMIYYFEHYLYPPLKPSTLFYHHPLGRGCWNSPRWIRRIFTQTSLCFYKTLLIV